MTGQIPWQYSGRSCPHAHYLWHRDRLHLLSLDWYSGSDARLLSLPDALMLFVLVALPGLLFVSAFSVALPAVMWLPLYQFLFVCYWFWGNALAPSRGLPTLSDTILTPLGGYMLAGFFGEDSGLVVHQGTFLQGLESLLLLLAIAGAVIVVLWRFLMWQRARQ